MIDLVVIPLIKIVIVLTAVLVTVMYLVLLERKVQAWVQVRLGPMRVGPHGALQPIADRTATWTQLDLAPTGTIRVYSSVRDVPAVADLVTARHFAELGREVTVSTPQLVSTLVQGFDPATGSRLVWKHVPAK